MQFVGKKRIREFLQWKALLWRALQGCVATIVFFAFFGSATDNLQAGCNYRDGHRMNRAEAELDGSKLSFLGHLIYEGGEFKVVPWQESPPCEGPNCQADEDPPTSAGTSSSPVRLVATLFVCDARRMSIRTKTAKAISLNDLSPIAGYPHEHEYPP